MKLRNSMMFTLLLVLMSVVAHAADPAPTAAPPKGLSLLPAAAAEVKKEAAAAKPQSGFRIGYVDMGRVSQESNVGKQAQASVKERKDKLQTRIDARRKQLDKQRAAIEEKLPTMTPKVREAKLKEFQKKVADFQAFGQQADKELQQLQDDLAAGFATSVEKAATDQGVASGVGLVVIRKELLYVDSRVEAVDVTDDVIRRMNEAAAKK